MCVCVLCVVCMSECVYVLGEGGGEGEKGIYKSEKKKERVTRGRSGGVVSAKRKA